MPRLDDDEEREEIGELYNALENRDRDIADLETRLQRQQNQFQQHFHLQNQQQQQRRRRFNPNYVGDDFDYTTNQLHEHVHGHDHDREHAENQMIRQENIKYRKLISELQAELSQGNATESEMIQLKQQLQSQRNLIDSQKRQLLTMERKRREDAQRSKLTSGELYQLETEHMRLRETMQQREQNELNLVSEVEALVDQRYHLELNVQAKERDMEDLVGRMEEKDGLCHSLERENSLLLGKIKSFEDKEEGWKTQMKEILKSHGEEVVRLRTELEAEKVKNQGLIVRAKRTKEAEDDGGGGDDHDHSIELEELRTSLGIMTARVQKYEAENRIMERDVRSAYMAMEEARMERDVIAEDIATRESKLSEKLTRQLEDAEQRETAMKISMDDVQLQMSQLRDALRSAEERNSWYEDGHGLSEAVQYQKKLEADVRRREVDFQRCMLDVNRKNDRIATLGRICQAMKDKLSSSGQVVNEEELEAIINVEDHGLRGQNKELSQQVQTLEEERNTLLRRLRKNAAMISEDGIRFLGLSSEQMVLLVDFAHNLKEGRVDVPLDNRSVELSAELASLKATRQSDLMCIERLEREVEILKTMKGQDDVLISTELRGILDSIEAQNKSLREQVQSLTKHQHTTSLNQKDEVKISANLQEKIKVIIGENVDSMPSTKAYHHFMSMMREYEKLETELRVVKESLSSSSFRNYENEQPIKTLENDKEENTQCCQRSSEIQSLKENIPPVPSSPAPFVKPQMKNAQVQVGSDNGNNSDRAARRKLEKELQLAQEQLITVRAMLASSDAKVSRLQHSLTQHISVKKNKTRIDLAAAAVKELKLCLEEKNKLIAKYRAKELLRNRQAVAKEATCTTHSGGIPSEVKDHRHMASIDENIPSRHRVPEDEILPLVKQLERSSFLLKEKEANIESIKTMVHWKQRENRDLEVKQREKDDTIQRLREEIQLHLRRIEDANNKANLWQKERTEFNTQLDDMKNQLNAKEERIVHLTKTLTRRVTSLRTKNDELSKLSNVESELKRVRTLLNVSKSKFRSSKDKSDKNLALTQRKAEDAMEDATRMQSEIYRLRKEVTQLKDEKHLIFNKSRKQAVKIQELKDIVRIVQQQQDGDYVHEMEEEYKRKILSLKTDNSKLRGLVASYRLKNGIDAMTKHLSNNSGDPTGSATPSDRAASSIKRRGTNKQKDRGHPTEVKSETKSKEDWKESDEHRHEHKHEEKYRVLREEYEERISHLTKQVEMLMTKKSKSPKSDKNTMDLTLDENSNISVSKINGTIQELETKNETLQREVDDRKKESNALAKEAKMLKATNRELLEDIERLKKSSSPSTSSSSSSSLLKQHHDQNKMNENVSKLKRQVYQLQRKAEATDGEHARLLDENKRLRKELSSFDLEFFEQLEDLKYRYNEAKKTLEEFGIV